MAVFIADSAYMLSFFLYGGSLLLLLDWGLGLVPGAAWNPARRLLFRICFPVLKWNSRLFQNSPSSLGLHSLWAAFVLAALGRYGVPWLVLLSYSLRG